MGTEPILFLDVDGVISLFGFPADAPPPGRFLIVEGIAHFLSASAGEHLRRLADRFEPVWCTGWEERANDHLPHALGLPGHYPHLVFERRMGRGQIRHAHWKLDAIEAYAGSRPLAWIDDAHDEGCAAWASGRGAPTLLVTTEPAVGLTSADVARLEAWASGLRALSSERG
jgi:hypothetical protein